MAGWRGHPVSRLLEEHLQDEKRLALETIQGHLVSGDSHVATVASGAVEVLSSLLRMFHPREMPTPAEEEAFVDPVNVKR
jgi:hypothetical protein